VDDLSDITLADKTESVSELSQFTTANAISATSKTSDIAAASAVGSTDAFSGPVRTSAVDTAGLTNGQVAVYFCCFSSLSSNVYILSRVSSPDRWQSIDESLDFVVLYRTFLTFKL